MSASLRSIRPTPRQRCGLTLIELVIVVVLIGVLAAIAIPKFGTSKERAFVNSMKSDLRNLATVQETYFNDNTSTYATSVAAFGANYRTSTGVIVTIGDVTSSGWSATAEHPGTTQTCSIRVGGGDPLDVSCQ